MSVSLYNLTTAMLALLDSEEATDDQITAVFGEITAKDNRICHLRADINGEIAKFKAEEQRLAAIRKAMENKVARLEEYLKSNMQRLNITELNTDTFKITISPTAGTLEVEDETAIPAKYKTIVQTTTIDKNAIKSDIKNGESITGASIKPGWSLRIR